MEDLKDLKKQERQLRTSIKTIGKFVQTFRKEAHEKQIEVRLETLENAMRKFYTVRRKIELIVEEEDEKVDTKESPEQRIERLEALSDKREMEFEEVTRAVEEEYYEIKSSLIVLRPTDVACRRPVPDDTAIATQPSMSKVKLPDIKLPSFTGNVKDWVTFRDTFRSLIHNNIQLDNIDKFTYLRSSVSADARQEIDSIELSADNYEVAWQQLEKRFENKKLIVKAHLDAIFAIEPMRKESCEGLNYLINEFDRNLQMLSKIGENTSNWSTILAHMVCSRLDMATLRNWENQHNSKDVPKYEILIEFLRGQCAVLQSISSVRSNSDELKRFRQSATHATVQLARRCIFCGDSFHPVFRCDKFKAMSLTERVEEVNRKRLCRNCFGNGHFAEGCSRGSCNRCGKRHHTLLHYEHSPASPRPVIAAQGRPDTATPQPQQTHPKPQDQTQNTTPQPLQQQKPSTSYTTIRTLSQTIHPPPIVGQHTSVTLKAAGHSSPRPVLMSTAIVRVEDQYGNVSYARTLLDSCSELCYMTSGFANKLKCRESPAFVRVQGIGSGSVSSTKLVDANIQPRLPTISSFAENIQFYVLPRITRTLPISPVEVDLSNASTDLVLADPSYGKPGPVDMIIGAEVYYDLLEQGRKKLSEDGPTLQQTVFGWIISGRVSDQHCSARAATYITSTVDLQELIAKFWELEACHVSSTHSVEETACEELFERTTVRDSKGRFIVTLPKREIVMAKLGESKRIAEKRHMKEVTEEPCQEPAYYMPHHAVIKPDSTTTKLRVVFDGSCRTSTNVSLNDALMVGPVVQDDLISIILRFRLHRIALVADVEKMYRMVQVQPSDQHLQRILWRDSPDDPVKTFQLTTVTYGTSCAPYLATKCLTKLGRDCQSTYPLAARVIQKDFYVDDMLSGADSIDEANQLITEVIKVTNSACFTLRKWNSNFPKLLQNLPKHLRDDRSTLDLDLSNSTVKTLGLRWDTRSDSFQFNFPQWRYNASTITKRSVHSDAACLFDPLGLVGPVVVQAKIFIQQLWRIKCDWDDPLEEGFQSIWKEYKQNLMALESLSIPRWIGCTNDWSDAQLHGFCDASNVAYGACLYLRCTSSDGNTSVCLIASKSRVAPLENLKTKKRKISIPRLELSSALLLSHLFEKFHRNAPVKNAVFWTDSMIVKHWLASQPSRWQVFIANRVSEIQHITKDGVWKHVPGIENPADLISRGMSPAQLQYQNLWFNGPRWLSQDPEYWPCEEERSQEEFDPALLEERPSSVFTIQTLPPNEIFTLKSSYPELVRLVALLLRFRHNARVCNRQQRQLGSITLVELEQATCLLVRLSQQECFPAELLSLSKYGHTQGSSSITSLHPQLSKEGVMCVGGRLLHASIPEPRKHPFILHHHHPLATLIMRHYHLRLFHAGQQLLIASIRERFWPTSIHGLARKVIHECVACFKNKPKVLEQLMADLPPERVTPSSPFLKVGVDYCGPFLISYPNRRAKPVKCYVAIFVCLAVKAVHLEVVSDLITEAFLAALKRFIARRGKPQTIMCDNATTFVGAKRELIELHRLFCTQQFQDTITKDSAKDGIEFRFIPPRSPNFGGLWEAQVKSFKGHFKKTIGLRTLSVDEMQTAVVQIEAVLNSRPLTPVSSDPSDFTALTPGHFLAHRSLTSIPEPDLQAIPINRQSMWQRAQSITQQLWKRWSTQYLSDLHNRTKWTKQRDNISVGTMVLLKDDNAPPLKWNLARVVKIYHGSDENIRVVTVRTKDGCFDRGISKICVLPIRDNAQQSTADGN